MELSTKISIIVPAAAIFALVGGTAGLASSGTLDDDAGETTITGTARENAARAALEHTGEGHVTATEDEADEGQYEVEVTLNNGSQVDVDLDRNFQVITSEADDDDGDRDDRDDGLFDD